MKVQTGHSADVVGPYHGDYLTYGDSINGCETWSNCGPGTLNLNSQLVLSRTNTTGTGEIGVGSTSEDPVSAMVVLLRWMTC